MTFQVPVHIEDTISQTPIRDEQIVITERPDSVSEQAACVSKTHIRQIVQKVAGILAAQGISCCECSKVQYKLYSLSDCRDAKSKYSLEIRCPDGFTAYQFELTLSQINTGAASDDASSKKQKGWI